PDATGAALAVLALEAAGALGLPMLAPAGTALGEDAVDAGLGEPLAGVVGVVPPPPPPPPPGVGAVPAPDGKPADVKPVGAAADAVGPLPVGPFDNGLLLLPDELPEPFPDVGEPLVGVPVVPGTIVVVVVV